MKIKCFALLCFLFFSFLLAKDKKVEFSNSESTEDYFKLFNKSFNILKMNYGLRDHQILLILFLMVIHHMIVEVQFIHQQ